MWKNNAFHLVPQVAVNNKLWYSGCLFYVVSSDYPFRFIIKFLWFPSGKGNFFFPKPHESWEVLRDLESPFSLHFLTHATGKTPYFTAVLSVHNRTDSVHQGPLKEQWQVSLFWLENTLWTAFMWTFDLRKKLPCSRNKTAATRPTFPFLGNQETYSQQLYIQFIIHNKVSTGLIMPQEKKIKISKLMEIIIIIKSTELHFCINLYWHRWISAILDVHRNKSASPGT